MIALWSLLVLAPLAGGSVRVSVLPVLAMLAAIVYLAMVMSRVSSRRPIRFPLISVVLLLLAGATCVQSIPLPAWLVGFISPRVLEVRQFVGATADWAPLTYEHAATANGAALLIVYAIVAGGAHQQARAHGGYRKVAVAVVLAGVASLVVALLHRLLGLELMLGFLSSSAPANEMVTTFANENHGAGFLTLACLTALGLAVDEERSSHRVLLFGAAAATAVASVLCFSRGGLLSLGGGLVLFAILVARRRTESIGRRAWILIGVPLGALALGIAWFIKTLVTDAEDPLAVSSKIAAMQDAFPLILDHFWVGIGLGSYESVYTAYKTSAHQLTFTHPENVIVQLVADWGMVVGSVALIGLVVCITARVKRNLTSPAILGGIVGVVALFVQNLADFSLAIPGVAIAVAALLGATSRGGREAKLRSISRIKRIGVGLVPILVLIATTVGALSLGDLEQDLSSFENARVSDIDQLQMVAARHPANAVMVARLAFLAETSEPPDLKGAFRWANRTLLLAPTYADAHLMTGRLLLRAGYRKQGFVAMRPAWRLGGELLRAHIDHIVALANTPDEIYAAMPRRDPALDVVEESELIRCVMRLPRERHLWGRVLLGRLPKDLDPSLWVPVGRAANRMGDHELAVRALKLQLDSVPNDIDAARLMLDTRNKQGEHGEVERLLTVFLERSDLDPIPFLFFRLRNALEGRRLGVAKDTIVELKKVVSGRKERVTLAKLEADMFVAEGQLITALESLDTAVRLAPDRIDIRLARARILVRTKRLAEARLELKTVLRQSPQHKQAAQLLQRLSASGSSPER